MLGYVSATSASMDRKRRTWCFLILDDSLEIGHDVGVLDGFRLPAVFSNGRQLALDGVLKKGRQLLGIAIVGGGPVVGPAPLDAPQAGVQPHLVGEGGEDVQMVHLHNADLVKAPGERRVLGGEENAVVEVETDSGHLGVVAAHVAQHGVGVLFPMGFRLDGG